MRNLYKYMGMKSVKSIEDRLFAVIQKIMNESIEASYIFQYDYFNKLKNISVNVNIRMYNFDDVQCTVIPSVAYGFVTGMNLQLC